ncbi:MAG: endonuclease/exonuclease/phosphatase family protein [Bryobacteraceae bacterium]
MALVSFSLAGSVHYSAPQLPTFDELLLLSEISKPGGELGKRLYALLHTPFISNEAYYFGAKPHRPIREDFGPILRVGQWNIERGREFNLIQHAFTNPAAFEAERLRRGGNGKDVAAIRAQAAVLARSDVLILNEADLGTTRSDYRDVAKELAATLHMNYAFGVEFVEIDKLNLGIGLPELENKELNEELRKTLAVDRNRYKGLSGTAILSRYRIMDVKIHRLKPCYDWFGTEKKKIAELEKGRRWSVKQVFLERISRELRHGNRMALIAKLAVPESPTGAVTVVASHLESRCAPKCRRQQMEELLAQIQEIDGPVILGGDLNTSGSDTAPVTVRSVIEKRMKSPSFWAGQALSWFTPLGFPRMFLLPANYWKNHRDPTAHNVPVFAANREASLFSVVEDFRFSDGHSFDFRGDDSRTSGNRRGTLSNSNERAGKGFKPTFSFQRDYMGMVGSFKLDWILVKPLGEQFAPHFPLTLQELNESVPNQLSDHNPITVDLPLNQQIVNDVAVHVR